MLRISSWHGQHIETEQCLDCDIVVDYRYDNIKPSLL